MAELLMDGLADLNAEIEGLQRDLAFAEATRAEYRPYEPDEGSVIRFVKYNLSYAYAAIRVNSRWYLTQSGLSQYARSSKTWDELLDWIGERNWHRVEILT